MRAAMRKVQAEAGRKHDPKVVAALARVLEDGKGAAG